MPSLTRIIAFLVVLFAASEAEVEFTYSTLYGIYDFQGESEIPLPRCDSGCLIFVSTGGIYQPSDNGFDPYHTKLLIYDPVTDKNVSLTEFSRNYQTDSQKTPIEFTENGTYSIMNLNDEATDNGTDITVWVIERERALEIEYEIYDAMLMKRTQAVPNSVVTIMSAQSFRVTTQPGEDNSYTARLVGFDNAFDDNPDECVDVAKTPVGSKFYGFEYQIDGPLFSLLFANKNKVDLKADYNYWYIRSLTNDAFIASSGYLGCALLENEYHRSKYGNLFPSIDLHGEPDYWAISINAELNLADGNEIFLIDMSNAYVRPLRGNQSNAQEFFPFTKYLVIQTGSVKGPQSFLIRYNSSIVQYAETLPSTTPEDEFFITSYFISPLTALKYVQINYSFPVTTACPTFPTSIPTTSTFTPTTSAAGSITGLIAAAAAILRLH